MENSTDSPSVTFLPVAEAAPDWGLTGSPQSTGEKKKVPSSQEIAWYLLLKIRQSLESKLICDHYQLSWNQVVSYHSWTQPVTIAPSKLQWTAPHPISRLGWEPTLPLSVWIFSQPFTSSWDQDIQSWLLSIAWQCPKQNKTSQPKKSSLQRLKSPSKNPAFFSHTLKLAHPRVPHYKEVFLNQSINY